MKSSPSFCQVVLVGWVASCSDDGLKVQVRVEGSEGMSEIAVELDSPADCALGDLVRASGCMARGGVVQAWGPGGYLASIEGMGSTGADSGPPDARRVVVPAGPPARPSGAPAGGPPRPGGLGRPGFARPMVQTPGAGAAPVPAPVPPRAAAPAGLSAVRATTAGVPVAPRPGFVRPVPGAAIPRAPGARPAPAAVQSVPVVAASVASRPAASSRRGSAMMTQGMELADIYGPAGEQAVAEDDDAPGTGAPAMGVARTHMVGPRPLAHALTAPGATSSATPGRPTGNMLAGADEIDDAIPF